MQIGPGVPELWSEKQTDRQTEITTLYLETEERLRLCLIKENDKHIFIIFYFCNKFSIRIILNLEYELLLNSFWWMGGGSLLKRMNAIWLQKIGLYA